VRVIEEAVAAIFGMWVHFDVKWLEAQSRLASGYHFPPSIPAKILPRHRPEWRKAYIAQPCRRFKIPATGPCKVQTLVTFSFPV
jgi:hypothetical protein